MSTLFAIANDRLSAKVSSLGAELQDLRDADGNLLQWTGDPGVWSGRAPVLFPIVGTLRGDGYRLDGRTYAMGRHGFARRSEFELLDRASDAVTLRLSASPQTQAAYPFDFELRLSFRLEGATLTLAATIANRGDRDMPASFGFHPAFAWPLPYGRPRRDHAIRFADDEPAPIRRLDAQGLLVAEPSPTPVEGGVLSLRDDLFTDDALIFDRLAGRTVRYGAGDGPYLDVAFADFPLLGMWTKPGASFVCIEPWSGSSDPEGFTGDIWEKPGVLRIPAGGERRLAMAVTLHGA